MTWRAVPVVLTEDRQTDREEGSGEVDRTWAALAIATTMRASANAPPVASRPDAPGLSEQSRTANFPVGAVCVTVASFFQGGGCADNGAA